MRYWVILIIGILVLSCSETDKERITRLVKEWEGKEILFPDNIVYTVYGMDTVDYTLPKSSYTIVSYIDSVGCTSCKLQLNRWEAYMHEMDSLLQGDVAFRFIFHPKDKKELTYLLKRDKFDFPVWIDNVDRFVSMNSLPQERIFHSFLLNKENKVVAIGDPVQNPKIKALYEKVMTGQIASNRDVPNTTIRLEQTELDLGIFNWQETQKAVFTIHNTGEHILVVNDIVTSCGCMTVEYTREPIRPGGKLELTIIYKADQPEYVNKSMKVYANVDSSPVTLRAKGKAE